MHRAILDESNRGLEWPIIRFFHLWFYSLSSTCRVLIRRGSRFCWLTEHEIAKPCSPCIFHNLSCEFHDVWSTVVFKQNKVFHSDASQRNGRPTCNRGRAAVRSGVYHFAGLNSVRNSQKRIYPLCWRHAAARPDIK